MEEKTNKPIGVDDLFAIYAENLQDTFSGEEISRRKNALEDKLESFLSRKGWALYQEIVDINCDIEVRQVEEAFKTGFDTAVNLFGEAKGNPQCKKIISRALEYWSKHAE